MAEIIAHTLGEVEPGVTLADLASPEACDAVLDRLVSEIASIEMQLAHTPGYYTNRAEGWRGRAKAALRHKKMMLPRLQARRAEISRQAKQALHQAKLTGEPPHPAGKKRRILIGIAWEHEPAAMRRVEALARQLHPDLFAFEEKAA